MKNFSNTDEIQRALSAYVDGELDFADRRKVEELIQSDPTYAQDVEELRLLKRWLQDMPAPASRRSFTLDPATAPRPRRLVFPTLRWATAVAAVLLMLTLGADVIGSIDSGFGGGAQIGAVPAASGSTASGTNASAARSVGAASASASSATAQDLPDTAAQEAAVPSASASAASVSAAASAGAAASMAADQSSGASGTGAASTYPAPSESLAAATLASPSTANGASASLSASGGAGASIVAAPSLGDTDTTGPDTVAVTAQSEPQSTPANTLRIAQIVLLIATVALGTGAWFARRRNI